MKSLVLANTTHLEIDNPQSPIADERRVLEACHEALDLGRRAVGKALLAGTLLLEYRESLVRSSHGGNSKPYLSIKHNQGTAKDDQFLPWLAKHNIARNTAYRWMAAAERVSRFALGIGTGDVFTPTIEVEGVAMPLSQVLGMPEDELSDAALEYKLTRAALITSGRAESKFLSLGKGESELDATLRPATLPWNLVSEHYEFQ